MANDPQFVRLVDRMARSTQVDLNSGWSIAGLDVKEFPEDELAQDYVRSAIRRGTLEPCGQSEYDAVNDHDLDFLGKAGITVKEVEIEGHFQEGHIAALAEDTRHRIESSRGLTSSGASFGDEKVRKAALLRAQQQLDDGAAPAEVEADASGQVDPEEAAKENKAIADEQDKATADSKRSRSKASAAPAQQQQSKSS